MHLIVSVQHCRNPALINCTLMKKSKSLSPQISSLQISAEFRGDFETWGTRLKKEAPWIIQSCLDLMDVNWKKTPTNHLNMSWSTELWTEILAHRDTHARVCTHIDVCAEPAVISLAIPMNYVMGKWKYAVELLTPGAFCKKAVLGSVQRDIPGTYWLMINWLMVSILQDSCWSLDGGNSAALHTTSCQSVQNGNLEKLLDRSRCLATCRQSSVLGKGKPS